MSMLSAHGAEFLALASIHLLAVVAPGPDFAVTVHQSLRFGRRAGVCTALGIGAGISVHVLYTLLGVGALLHAWPWLLQLAQLLGGGYLLYLGAMFIWRAARSSADPAMGEQVGGAAMHSAWQSWWLGFLTNATNPKATLFFLAVFTTVVSSSTPLQVQVFYGLWMCAVNAAWFVLVGLLFTNPTIRKRFLRCRAVLERLMGALLLVFAGRLLWGALP
ncbi:LysE family translocator [Comamonas sp. GB3 AK4-5]|uniref:LysE family translocator n=1 Tax=Comamonas sp. GB3 AK4-5 TaxID=3231487 RepID=UPI00351EBA0E